MVISLILSIVIFSLILIKAADMVIVAIRRISKEVRAGIFAVSAIILALGTSFPELFVGVTSALEDTPQLSLGVVIGSNIANIALIGGMTSMIAGSIRIHGNYLKNDVWIALLAGILPLFLLLDKGLNRIDGLILITVYFAYATGFFRRRYIQIGREQQEEDSFIYRFVRKFNHISSLKRREFGRLFVGIAILLFSADIIVKLSKSLAEHANLPVFVVGLVVLAIGTSLPEFAFSLRSVEEHEPSMFFGNILGSIIANSTLVIGLAALIKPFKLIAYESYVFAGLAFILVFLTFWYFIKTKHRLDRWEAFILLLFYIVLLVVEFV